MTILDMTGKPCPIPVVEAKKALAQPKADAVQLIVDNIVAVQNLKKMADGMGYAFAQTQQGEDKYVVVLAVQEGAAPAVAEQANATESAANGGLAVLITSACMGTGEDELGKMLMKGFIFSLTELTPTPEAVIFLNSGAYLTSEGSAAIEDLKALEEKGCEVLTCGTCANYYKIAEKLAVGTITDMMGITTRTAGAARLITL